MKIGLLAIAALSLLAAGCSGGADDDAGVITTNAVSAALAGTVEVPVYRVTTSATQLLTMPDMGPDSGPQPAGAAPTVAATVAHDRQHFVISVALPPGTQIAGGSIETEMWSDRERLVVDTRDYQRMVDAAPGTDLGPFAPGLFFVDVAAIGSSHPELLDALVGVSPPSLRDLAENLPAALDTIEQTSEDPPIFVGSTTGASLRRALGVDLADTVRFTVAGMSLVSPVNIDELTELLFEAYSAAEAEVVIELDDQGLLSVLSTREDLSGVLTAILRTETLADGMTDHERQEAQEALEGAEFIVETRSVYETGVELEVPLPPAATEDRTDEWSEYLINAGFDR